MSFLRERQLRLSRPVEPRYGYSLLERALAGIGLYGMAMGHARRRIAWEASRAYLAAAEKNRLTSGWGKIGTTNPNDITDTDALAAGQLSDWLALNDGYAAKVVQTILDETLSGGVGTQCKVAYSKNRTENERVNGQVEDLKSRWMEEADAFGRMHWFDMEALVLRRVILRGDCGLYRRFIPDPNRVLPLAYEVIEGSRLTTYRVEPAKGNEVIQGVEIDADGRVVAYHIEKDGLGTMTYLKTVRIPAEDMLWPFVIYFPTQYRGIPWLAPVVRDLFDMRDLKEYAMIARKVQSAIAIIVSEDPKGGAPPSVPGLNVQSGGSITNNTGDPMRKIEPGMIQNAGTGKVTSHIPSPSADLDTLSAILARGVGCGLGLSYEWVTGDYTKTTHAGGRLGNQYPRKRILHTHGWFCRRVLGPVHREFVNMALAMGKMKAPGIKADPYAVRFGRPHWEWGVNPSQEVNAAIDAIAGGISTFREEIESRGGDWEDFLRQVQAEIEFGDSLGLTLHAALRGLAGAGTGKDAGGGPGGQEQGTQGQEQGETDEGAEQ